VEEPIIMEDPLADPADAVVVQLVREAARRAMADLQADVRASGADLSAVSEQTGRLRHWLEELDEPATSRSACDRLLAWLSERELEG